MSVAQFDALLAILEPHIKKTTNFCELGVQGFYSALLRDKMDQLDNPHSGFCRLFVRWLWVVKTPLNVLATDAKNTENWIHSEVMTDESFGGSV